MILKYVKTATKTMYVFLWKVLIDFLENSGELIFCDSLILEYFKITSRRGAPTQNKFNRHNYISEMLFLLA